MAAVGLTLSTVKVDPAVGTVVITFPAKSSPTDKLTVPVPSPVGTV